MASYEAAAGQYYGEGGMAGYADGATAGYADYTAGGGADYSAEAAATAPEYAPAGSAQAAGWAQAAGDAGEQSGLEQQSEPAAPPLSPASHLEQLEQQQVALAEQKEQTEVQLVQAATVAYQQASAKLGPDSTGVALPAELPLLVEELSVLQAARQYLAYLQVGAHLPHGVQPPTWLAAGSPLHSRGWLSMWGPGVWSLFSCDAGLAVGTTAPQLAGWGKDDWPGGVGLHLPAVATICDCHHVIANQPNRPPLFP